MRTRSSWIWCWVIGAVLASVAGAQQYTTIIDNLPTCTGNRNGRVISVSDAVSDTDCTVGGATGTDRFVHQCICDTLNALGPYWKAVGGVDLSAYALLAGDADGQTIQGRTGANAARVDIGETDANQAALIGGGATHGFVFAHDGGIYGESPDGQTSFDLYNAGLNMSTDGDASFTGETSTNLGSAAGFTAINGSRVNVTSLQTPPTNADDPCTAGDTIDSATFHYFCAATDTWVRVAMATW